MKLFVLHNPAAGNGDFTAGRVTDLLRNAGHTVELVSKLKHVDVDASPDAFVAAGGDGTVHELLHAVAGRGVPVAIIPTGTANNVAHAFGYAVGDDLRARVAAWQEKETLFGLAEIRRGRRKRHFIEAAGLGVFTLLMRNSRSSREKKAAARDLLGVRRKLVKRLLKAKPFEVTVHIDDCTTTGEYLMLECMNLPCYGPRLWLAPDQVASAGTVTVVGISPGDREAAAQWIATGVGDPTRFSMGAGATLQITADQPAHVDGERWPDEDTPAGRLRIRASARAVPVWV